MSTEIHSLVELYFKRINAKETNIYAKKNVFMDINSLIKEGFSIQDIETAIKRNPIEYKKEIYKKDTKPIYRGVVKDKVDLLKGRFHFHPYTQESLGPPILYQNEDGTFTESYSKEEFYLKIKEKLTFEDILEYVYKRFPHVNRSRNKDLGALKHVYNKRLIPLVEAVDDEISEVDVMLFTIDAASTIAEDKDIRLRNPLLEISNYLEDGLELYRDKVEICKLSDLSYVQ